MATYGSYWTLCIPAPQGEDCIELGAKLPEWPPGVPFPDPTELADLGRLQALAGQVADPALRMRLTQARDETALRLNTRLSGGAQLRYHRAATHDDLTEFEVPNVTGLSEQDGWNILQAAGYWVASEPEWTSEGGSDVGTIAAQSPAPGTPVWPTTVYIYVVTYAPPDPPWHPMDPLQTVRD